MRAGDAPDQFAKIHCHAGLALAHDCAYNAAFTASRNGGPRRIGARLECPAAKVSKSPKPTLRTAEHPFLHAWRKLMAVPMKKVSRQKRGSRRSHDTLSAPTYVEDKESGERRRPHHIDLKSGKYRGRQILEPKSDV